MNFGTRCLLGISAASVFMTSLPGCSSDTTNPGTAVDAKSVVQTYSRIVEATYADALTRAQALKTACRQLVSAPSEATLDAARTAYVNARYPYGQSDVFRFYGGPIDDDNGPEGAMNGWPLDEAYIDYVVGAESSGVVNDLMTIPVITKDAIRAINEQGGETNISCGYHAVEFLLWGQDLYVDSPGRRPYTDYVQGGRANADRRGQYLLAVVDMLIDDLTYVHDAWASGAEYRTKFEAMNPDDALKLVLTGAGKFTIGELAGERMEVAWNNADQEDEHSCFSDQTHMDVRLGQMGIRNVLTGTYVTLDGRQITGASFVALVAARNATLAQTLQRSIEKADAEAVSIHAPFDQEIIQADGRIRVKNAINALVAEGVALQDAARALGITLEL